MAMYLACIVGALVLSLFACSLALVGVAGVSADMGLRCQHDPRDAAWEERVARRVLRARYAEGRVSSDEYRRLCYELEEGHAL